MHPFEQQVRERAYFIWEGEGRVFGRATDHWLRAEHELAADAPVLLRPVADAISLAPSPARTLKPKAAARSAAKAVTSTVETAKPAKAPAAKTAKATATKAATAKTTSAKTTSAKTASEKTASAKRTSTKTAAARSKAFGVEAGIVMH